MTNRPSLACATCAADGSIEFGKIYFSIHGSVATEELGELQAEAREAQLAGDDDRLLAIAPTLFWLKSELEVFADVGAGDQVRREVVEAADRLLGWLRSRRGEGA